MSDIEITATKLHQPIACKCGRALAPGDAKPTLEGIEIVCSGCHQTVMELHLEVYAEAEPWD